MKKIKNKTQAQSQESNIGKNKLMIWGISGAVFLLLMVIILIAEGNKGKLTIRNNTQLKLEYVKTYFVYSEGPVTEDNMTYEEILEGKYINDVVQEINLSGLEANLEVRFKFENYDEMFVDAGYFNDNFYGDIKIVFDQIDDDNIELKVKASNGILPSRTTKCDDEFNIYLSEGYVD